MAGHGRLRVLQSSHCKDIGPRDSDFEDFSHRTLNLALAMWGEGLVSFSTKYKGRLDKKSTELARAS